MKNLQDFYKDLGQREASGDYKSKNVFGYLGLYQMGTDALIDAGYYDWAGKSNVNNWQDKYFTGKDGVYSVNDFLNNPQAQDNAMLEFKKKQWGYLKNAGVEKYIGKTINGINITESGVLSGAHLVGQKELIKYLSSNGTYIPKDGNGTSVEEYLKKFADYDVSEITGKSNIKDDFDTFYKLYGNVSYQQNELLNKQVTIHKILKFMFPLLYKSDSEIYKEAFNSVLKEKFKTQNKQSATSGKEHWVTIKGKHVLLPE